jgi:hypothetical protein
MIDVSQREELKSRVLEKKMMLEAKLEEAKADAKQVARVGAEQIEARLRDLERTVKDGWENVTEEVAARLNEWLKD